MRSSTYYVFDLKTSRGQPLQLRMYDDSTVEMFLYANGKWQAPARGYKNEFETIEKALLYVSSFRKTIHT